MGIERTRRTDFMVQWSQRLTIVGLLAVTIFVAAGRAQISSPPTASLQLDDVTSLKANVDRLSQEDARSQERLNSIQGRLTVLEGLTIDKRLTILEQYWLTAKDRDRSLMTMLYSIVGGLIVLALGQYLNLKESVKHRRAQRGSE